MGFVNRLHTLGGLSYIYFVRKSSGDSEKYSGCVKCGANGAVAKREKSSSCDGSKVRAHSHGICKWLHSQSGYFLLNPVV